MSFIKDNGLYRVNLSYFISYVLLLFADCFIILYYFDDDLTIILPESFKKIVPVMF